MHYRWWPLPSRYFRKDPEILADAREDYRVVAGLGNRTYVVEEARKAQDRVSRMMSGR